jgi:glutamyl-tRNA synthetase
VPRAKRLGELVPFLGTVDRYDPAAVDKHLKAPRLKFGTLVHATRIAVTGRAVSPGLFETLTLIGRDRVVARLDALSRFLS